MKSKFNKDERRAIISKLEKLGKELEQKSWKEQREKYVPSENYIKAEKLIDVYNNTRETLREEFDIINTNYYNDRINKDYSLGELRDREIKHLVTRYKVNKDDIEVEIILSDKKDSVDELIEKLLELCLCK